jgi:uncharacterized protein (DUF1697 family)
VSEAHRYVAFLRAINIGTHQVKMEDLRRHFSPLGFDNISTFIASGNVIFDTSLTADDLEPLIEQHLQHCLGYPVETFVRSEDEIRAIAAHDPFAGEEGTSYVVLLRKAPDTATRERIEALNSEADLVAVHKREVYWKPRILHFSSVGAALQKILGKEHTVRNANTPRRLAVKFDAPETQAPRRSRKTSGSASTVTP